MVYKDSSHLTCVPSLFQVKSVYGTKGLYETGGARARGVNSDRYTSAEGPQL